MKFAVVIILDDRSPNGCSESEQLEPTTGRHQPSRRVLVGRGHKNEARNVLAFAQSHTEIIEWHSSDDGTGALQCGERPAIPWTFNPGEIARANHHFGYQRNPRLCGRHYDDLARRRLDAPMLGQMLLQCLLQCGTVVGTISPYRGATGCTPQAAGPNIVRELPLVSQSRLKRARSSPIDWRPTRVTETAGPGRHPEVYWRAIGLYSLRLPCIKRDAG